MQGHSTMLLPCSRSTQALVLLVGIWGSQPTQGGWVCLSKESGCGTSTKEECVCVCVCARACALVSVCRSWHKELNLHKLSYWTGQKVRSVLSKNKIRTFSYTPRTVLHNTFTTWMNFLANPIYMIQLQLKTRKHIGVIIYILQKTFFF